MTTENPTKSNGDPKTRQKHPKSEPDQKKKRDLTPQKTWNLPDVLLNVQSTRNHQKTRLKPNKTQGRPKTRQKHPKKELDVKKKKSKKNEFPPKTTLKSPDLLQIPHFTPIHHNDEQEPN